MYTLEQHTALSAAIAIGALKVQYSDKEVTYRSLDEMLRILGLMEQQLQIGAFSPTAQGKRRVADFSSGIH